MLLFLQLCLAILDGWGYCRIYTSLGLGSGVLFREAVISRNKGVDE